MSKNINVNPAHYKVAGRERQGEDIHQDRNKRTYTRSKARIEKDTSSRVAGAAPTRGRKDPGKAVR